jgi:CheY-like chemotaxis protein/signal transduction histidine kinase
VSSDGKVRILAVDDNPAKLLALSAILSDLKETLVTAASGREALRLLLQQEFAVVLLDVHMPGMDGFETAALMRQRKSSEHTPIIFVTSYPDDTHASRGYSLGAVDYILAPIEPEVLQAKVGVFVELFRKTQQIRFQADTLEERARQLHRLTQASLAINSALSLERMLQIVTDHAREILDANQAVALAAPDLKWSALRRAVSLPAEAPDSDVRVIPDEASLVALLNDMPQAVRLPRGALAPEWASCLDPAASAGWLAAPLTGRDGRPIGVLYLLEKRAGDFSSEDESILTQLAQMSSISIENAINAEAREANRMKDEFLTTLSHELRTPLSAILGWTRLLRSERPGAPKLKEGLEVIERNVMAQAKLIDDLLDVSRIITGKLRLQLRPAAVSEVIAAAMNAMRPAAESKKIRMEFRNSLGPEDDRILGDPDRLQQIIWNLVSNSIKFTPPGGEVAVALSRVDGQFQITVRDTGMGMNAEFLARAFDRFRQADSSTTRAHGGLGLGLAIARHLAELHGGTIAAESGGPGLGSTFTILLPAAALAAAGGEPRTPEPRPRTAAHDLTAFRLAGVGVLVVEDQWDTRDLLAEILGSAGCRVVAVGSAAEAMEAFDAAPPDVLVSDIGMPGEDGYSLLRRIRQRPASAGGKVPAIAISAYAREEDRIRSLAAGFQIHIAKPFEPAEVLAAVGRMASRRARTPPAESERRLARRASVGPAPDVLVIEDDADLREGLRGLIEEWGHAVEVAESGPAGIEHAVARRPRVALVDIGLPGVSGFDVARRIRSLLDRKDITLVALTGRAEAEDLEQALACGFDAHLTKPIAFERLRILLSERLSRAGETPRA